MRLDEILLVGGVFHRDLLGAFDAETVGREWAGLCQREQLVEALFGAVIRRVGLSDVVEGLLASRLRKAVLAVVGGGVSELVQTQRNLFRMILILRQKLAAER